jgi:hypothetical protein
MFYTQIWMDANTVAKVDKIARVLGVDIDDAIAVLIDEAYPLYEGRDDDDGTIDPVGVIV